VSPWALRPPRVSARLVQSEQGARLRRASRRCASQQQPIVGLVVVSPRSLIGKSVTQFAALPFVEWHGAAREIRHQLGRLDTMLRVVIVVPPKGVMPEGERTGVPLRERRPTQT
jgi:hypothetical protein